MKLFKELSLESPLYEIKNNGEIKVWEIWKIGYTDPPKKSLLKIHVWGREDGFLALPHESSCDIKGLPAQESNLRLISTDKDMTKSIARERAHNQYQEMCKKFKEVVKEIDNL